MAERTAERRERILAAARRLIEEVGYEGVTIRNLARESRVSVPTLYKFFGDKDHLLIDAVEEQFTNVIQAIESTPSLRGLDHLLAVLEGCCREMLRTSRYSKAVLAVFVHSGKTSAVMQVVGRDLVEVLVVALEEMQGAGELVDWVDRRALAERLSAHQMMVCIEWESGNLANRSLYPTMAFGAAMMLLGVARGKAKKRLETLIDEVQADAQLRHRPAATGSARRNGRARRSAR